MRYISLFSLFLLVTPANAWGMGITFLLMLALCPIARKYFPHRQLREGAGTKGITFAAAAAIAIWLGVGFCFRWTYSGNVAAIADALRVPKNVLLMIAAAPLSALSAWGIRNILAFAKEESGGITLPDPGDNRAGMLGALLLGALILVPLLLIGKYNRPSADDYSYSMLTRAAVQSGGGLSDVLKAAWDTNVRFYNTWQGLYVSAFLEALQPGIFGEASYGMTTVLLAAFALGCLLWSMHILNKRLFHAPKLFVFSAAVFTLAFLALCMPSPNQGLYWFCGAVNYMPWVFTNLLSLCFLLECEKAEGRGRKVLLIAFVTILSFLTSGGNHVTAFANILCMLFALAFMWVRKRGFCALFPLLSACAGFVVMYIAPGTGVRQAALEKASVSETVVHAALEFVNVTCSWATIPFLLSLMIITPVAIRFAKHNPSKDPKRFPWIAPLVSAVVLCGMLSVPYYAMGYFGEGRLTNVIYAAFVLLGWMNYILIFRWAYENRIVRVSAQRPIGKRRRALVACAVALLMILFPQDGTPSSALLALKELADGTAKEYAAEADARYAVLNDAASPQDVVLPELKTRSELLYFCDATSDPDDWRNADMSRYYGKASIRVVE